MTARKKKGVGFLISGIVTVVLGGVFIGTEVTPEWVGLALSLVGTVANVLGFTTVFPDTE